MVVAPHRIRRVLTTRPPDVYLLACSRAVWGRCQLWSTPHAPPLGKLRHVFWLQDYGQLDAIMSFWELSQPLVSRLCEHFNLPCNPPAAVDDARDKQVSHSMQRLLQLLALASGRICSVHGQA